MTATIPLGLTLALSKHVADTRDAMHRATVDNLAFVCSQAPGDAATVAKALRSLIQQATAAALAFEEAAKIKWE